MPTLILVTGLSSRIRSVAEGKGHRPQPVVVAAYLAIYLGLDFLLNFPLRYYAGFVRPHDYGLSTQSFGRWLGDALKGLGVNLAIGSMILWGPYRAIGRSPRYWWLIVGVTALPFAAAGVFLTPLVIEPLFNQFGPMHDKALEARIDALARRAGIEGGRIFEVDKSRETTTVNAYVNGLFGSKRIVLWDTLLAKLDGDEVLVVMGHEMGHYVLNHVALGMTLASIAAIGGLFLVDRAALALIRRHHRRFGFDRLADVASLPLLIALIQGLMVLSAPLSNASSRWMEREADRFGAEITRSSHAGASGFAKMQADNLAIPYPDPFSRLWRSTHPPIGDRIEFFNHYRPWESGQPLRYGHLFRDP